MPGRERGKNNVVQVGGKNGGAVTLNVNQGKERAAHRIWHNSRKRRRLEGVSK